MLIPLSHLVQKYGVSPIGVVHLGANTGQEASEYHRLLDPMAVIWVEALPHVHRLLTRHISQFPGMAALQACLSDVDGKQVVFNVSSNQAQSSSFLEFGTHSKEHPTVVFTHSVPMETRRLDSLFAEKGIVLSGDSWFLNVDLQGAELLALRGMGDLLRHFCYLYIEVNEKELYKGCPLVGEIDEFLRRNGFVGMETKMTKSGWGDKFYIREE